MSVFVCLFACLFACIAQVTVTAASVRFSAWLSKHLLRSVLRVKYIGSSRLLTCCTNVINLFIKVSFKLLSVMTNKSFILTLAELTDDDLSCTLFISDHRVNFFCSKKIIDEHFLMMQQASYNATREAYGTY